MSFSMKPATVAPLPVQRADLVRKTKSTQSLPDLVEFCVLELWDDERFHALIDAIDDAHAVEGSLKADSIMAADMIRNQAVKTNNVIVAQEKLVELARVLNTVLRRYGASRNERRARINGESQKQAAE